MDDKTLQVSEYRICSEKIESIIDFGDLALTGVFLEVGREVESY